MTINEILDVIVKRKINELNTKGYIPGGNNGPYYDNETPVRNTAHFITTLYYYYLRDQNPVYLDAINKCGDYLLSKEVRPFDKTVYCRQDKNKDLSNGVIGPAWVIEGLVSAFKASGERKYIDLAKKLFLMTPFDKEYKMWEIMDIDGKKKGFDLTFNHQLWFAAAGVQVLSVENDLEIRIRCKAFLNNIDEHIKSYSNGLIKHYINYGNFNENLKDKIYKLLKQKANQIRLYYKENGYHLFNIYAFALIKDHGFEIDYFNSKRFKKQVQYCFDKKLYKWLLRKSIRFDGNKMPHVKNNHFNIYGFSYNAPGFELPYIYKVFENIIGNKKDFVNLIVNKQIDLTYNEKDFTFNKNNEDSITLESRMYEYTRFLINK
ncbi:hypothetical protein [Lentibacillus sp. CBA3610]|uniref:hypothetical protein n=1 Tax=Lentibacillus sp. CBA3610 TaxID=2518176 RepID=UPI001595F9CD|nr:hypothetical protein [Lentibacillus sp. CBA3610]QKY70303.1 hypothetical protein Len3610_12495 [Lentibacillus sp. CBA3610]